MGGQVGLLHADDGIRYRMIDAERISELRLYADFEYVFQEFL